MNEKPSPYMLRVPLNPKERADLQSEAAILGMTLARWVKFIALREARVGGK